VLTRPHGPLGRDSLAIVDSSRLPLDEAVKCRIYQTVASWLDNHQSLEATASPVIWLAVPRATSVVNAEILPRERAGYLDAATRWSNGPSTPDFSYRQRKRRTVRALSPNISAA
jgi:hypothetical protein